MEVYEFNLGVELGGEKDAERLLDAMMMLACDGHGEGHAHECKRFVTATMKRIDDENE